MKIKIVDLVFTLILVLKVQCFETTTNLLEHNLDNNIHSEQNNEPEIYLPKFDYSNPEFYKGDSYQKISKFMGENYIKRSDVEPRDIFIANDDFRRHNQDTYITQLTTQLIKKEVNQEEIQYNRTYSIYGYPNATLYNKERPKLVQNYDMEIKDISDLGDMISFEPNVINVKDK